MNTSLRHVLAVASAALAMCGLAVTATAAGSAPAAAARPGQSAAKVPAGFQPAAASFQSPTSGVVLGGVGCTVQGTCQARLAATTDAGAHWHYLATPQVWLRGTGRPLVSQVLFTSGQTGWLFDQYGSDTVWATHDGGTHWARLTLPGAVAAMAAAGGNAYAMVYRSGADQLFRSPVARDAWARVGTMTLATQGASLAAFGTAAWFGNSTHLWTTANGVRWHEYPLHCPGYYQGPYQLDGIAPASRTEVAFLCDAPTGMFRTGKEVLVSVNGGRTTRLAGHAPVPGDVSGFATPPYRSTVLTIAVTYPGPNRLYRSASSGKTWAAVGLPGTGGVPVTSLSYVSRSVGWLLVGSPGIGPNRLMRTAAGGRTWTRVRF